MSGIQWMDFARIMNALKTRDDVDTAAAMLVRNRCLDLWNKHSIQPGDSAFALLSFLENGMKLKAVLRLSDKQVKARVQRIEASDGDA